MNPTHAVVFESLPDVPEEHRRREAPHQLSRADGCVCFNHRLGCPCNPTIASIFQDGYVPAIDLCRTS